MHKFYVIGHRGVAGEKFENSMSGFEHALTLDLDAVELDIHQNAGELWVIHDQELDRLTDASGKFYEHDDPSTLRLKNGEPIPRLREVLDLLWGKIPINIEIKSLNTGPMLLELLEHYPPVEAPSEFPWVLISSFDHRQILALSQASCPWSLGLVTHGIPINAKQLIETIRPFSWSMGRGFLDYDFIRQVQQQGVRVMIFTVNESSQALELKDAGIDGIFTDYPSELLSLL
jgi:glycerophosphoryl diester phosphodiesterase